MVIVMNTDSGSRIEDEFGAFQEEVLNAQWLPQPMLGLQQVPAHPAHLDAESSTAPAFDADAFLRTVYLSQE